MRTLEGLVVVVAFLSSYQFLSVLIRTGLPVDRFFSPVKVRFTKNQKGFFVVPPKTDRKKEQILFM